MIDLEAIFVEELKNFFVSPEEVASQLKLADSATAEKEQLLSVLTAEREKLGQEIDRVYRLYIDEKLDGDGFAQFYKPLDERRKQLDDELPRLQAEVDLRKIDHLSASQVLSEANDLYGRWPQLEREEKHRVIQSITEKIVIGPKDEIAISLCHLPSSEEMTKEQRKLATTAPSTRLRYAVPIVAPNHVTPFRSILHLFAFLCCSVSLPQRRSPRPPPSSASLLRLDSPRTLRLCVHLLFPRIL